MSKYVSEGKKPNLKQKYFSFQFWFDSFRESRMKCSLLSVDYRILNRAMQKL